MEFNWVVEQSLWITNREIQNIIKFVRQLEHSNISRDEAIKRAVRDYLYGQDDSIFYTITEEVTRQIEEYINKLLT